MDGCMELQALVADHLQLEVHESAVDYTSKVACL